MNNNWRENDKKMWTGNCVSYFMEIWKNIYFMTKRKYSLRLETILSIHEILNPISARETNKIFDWQGILSARDILTK